MAKISVDDKSDTVEAVRTKFPGMKVELDSPIKDELLPFVQHITDRIALCMGSVNTFRSDFTSDQCTIDDIAAMFMVPIADDKTNNASTDPLFDPIALSPAEETALYERLAHEEGLDPAEFAELFENDSVLTADQTDRLSEEFGVPLTPQMLVADLALILKQRQEKQN